MKTYTKLVLEPLEIEKRRINREYRKQYYLTVVKPKNDAYNKMINNYFTVKISKDNLFVEF
jgi:hypothetical protein